MSHNVACAVIRVALEAGLCTKVTRQRCPDDASLAKLVADKMYDPVYVPLVDPSKSG